MRVCLLTSLKFWQICHFCGPAGFCSVGSFGASHSGSVNAGGLPSCAYCSFTLCHSSSSVNPPCSCVFWASTVVVQHFTASGGAHSMIPASNISSMRPCKNCDCGGVSAHWWTLKLKVALSGVGTQFPLGSY